MYVTNVMLAKSSLQMSHFDICTNFFLNCFIFPYFQRQRWNAAQGQPGHANQQIHKQGQQIIQDQPMMHGPVQGQPQMQQQGQFRQGQPQMGQPQAGQQMGQGQFQAQQPRFVPQQPQVGQPQAGQPQMGQPQAVQPPSGQNAQPNQDFHQDLRAPDAKQP